MKVKMNQNCLGSNKGWDTISFIKDSIYEVPSQMSKELADVWLARGVCSLLEDVKKEEPKKESKEEQEVSIEDLKNKVELSLKDKKPKDLSQQEIDDLKEIGKSLNIKGIANTKKPEKIVDSVKKELGIN